MRNMQESHAHNRGGTPHSFDQAVGLSVMARAQGAIMASAGLLGYAGVLLPHDAGYNTFGLMAIQGTAIVGGTLLVLLADFAPRWLLRVNPPVSTVMTTLAIYFSGDVTSAYVLFYFWACIYAFYFFSWPEAIFNVAWVCANYSLVVAIQGAPPAGFANSGIEHHLVMTVGTMTVAGASLIALRGRVDQLFEKLTDAARTDVLTGLPNRAGLHESLERELERAAPEQRPVSILMLDLDRFKAINERFGLDVGDQLLRETAKLLDTETRLIDTVARSGGEEFSIILPETEQHRAFLFAEDLLKAIRDSYGGGSANGNGNGNGPSLTGSVGVATYPGHANDVTTLLSAADRALYAAKALGRDRAVIYSPEVTQTLGAVAGKRSVEDQAQLATVLSLAEALDQRDPSTSKHSQTVGRLCEMMATELDLGDERIQRIRLAGILHDIGKIGVPDSILRKPGPLNAEELAHMRRHPELGARILSGSEMDDVRDWIVAHHERPDGQGYPKGISGDDIPQEALILGVADAYEAMTADRVYRAALGPVKARQELLDCSGSQFDPAVVEALLAALDRESDLTPAGSSATALSP
jgi:diguanylate cyclase (GGDEF)-like protein/putative nucleotidyltransferase with HDIG domain